MPILFKPNGTLDVSTAATDLPQETDGRNIVSGAMTRCKNLSVDRIGVLELRNGSSRENASALDVRINFLLEQAGDRYAFGDQKIYKNESELTTSGLTDGDWSAISYNSFNETTQSVFALNGTDRKRIDSSGNVFPWGIAAPGSAPTDAVGSGTGLTGDYKFKITYARKDGTTVISESNPSDASDGVTVSNEDIDVSWTASSDDQVTHVRVYRTTAGGTVYFHDQDVAVGSTSVTTSTTDAALGDEVATDHDRPPAGSIVFGPIYGGVTFIAKDNLLYYSKSKQPEYWPSTNFIEVGPPSLSINAIVDFGGQLYCLTQNQIWFIQGTGGNRFVPLPLRSLTGAPNKFGAVAVEGHGIFHLGTDGLYRFSAGRDTKVSQTQLEKLFDEDTSLVNGMSPIAAWPVATQWLHQFENKVYFHYGVGNVLVFNLDNNRMKYDRFEQQLFAPMTDRTNHRFYVGDAGRFVRKLEDSSVTTDAGSTIDWEVQSKDFTLQTRAHFPRWVKYDVDASSGTDVTGNVILDGSVHQSHTLTGNRSTKRRLVKEGNGEREAIRITGTGAVSIYGAEAE